MLNPLAGSVSAPSAATGSILAGTAPPVYRPVAGHAQARMAPPPVYRPSTVQAQQTRLSAFTSQGGAARGAGVTNVRSSVPAPSARVPGGAPALLRAGVHAVCGTSIQAAKTVYVPIAPNASDIKNKKERQKEQARAKEMNQANLKLIGAAKAARKEDKDTAHQQWISALGRAGKLKGEEASENAKWEAHHVYAASRETARDRYERTIRSLQTSTGGIVGADGLAFGQLLHGDSAYEEIKVEGTKRKVYCRKDAQHKQYVKDAYGAYVRRKCFRCITGTEVSTVADHGLVRRPLDELEGQRYSEGSRAKLDAFARPLQTLEEESRDVLHQIIGGGPHQFQISATSSRSRELRSNAGLGFDSGDYGGTFEIDLAMVPPEIHVAAQYTIDAQTRRATVLGKALLAPTQRKQILRQVSTSAEKNIEVLLGRVPKEAIRKMP